MALLGYLREPKDRQRLGRPDTDNLLLSLPVSEPASSHNIKESHGLLLGPESVRPVQSAHTISAQSVSLAQSSEKDE